MPDFVNPVAASLQVSDIQLNTPPVSVLRFIDSSKHRGILENTSTYDATADIQVAMYAMPDNSALVFPRGTYLHGNVQIPSKSNFRIQGNGAKHILQGSGANGLGFELLGTLTNIEIFGHIFQGDGIKGNVHKAIWCNSGQTLTDINIHHNAGYDLVNGISLNANLSGSIDGGTISNNVFKRIVGIASGEGYGIHIAKVSAGSAYTLIAFNDIESAGRHAIYVARGSYFRVLGNVIRRHRADLTPAEQADGTDGWTKIRPAINVSRSNSVLVADNMIAAGYDGGIIINADPDAGPITVNDLHVMDNVLSAPANAVPLILVGDSSPATTGIVDGVTISGNRLSASGVNTDLIRHFAGKHVTYRDNAVSLKGVTATSAAMEVRATSDSGGTALYTDAVTIADNDLYVDTSNASTIRGLRVDSTLCTSAAGVDIDQARSTFGTLTPVFEAATVTNANYRKREANGACVGLYTAGATTPSVGRGVTQMIVANSGAVSITDLADGVNGQRVTLKFSDANTTIVNSSTMRLAGAVNFVSSNLDTLVLERVANGWYQVSVALN